MTWRALSLVGLVTIGCASSPETKQRNEIYMDAARACEIQFRSLHIDRVDAQGNVTVDVEAGQTQDVAGYRQCYWQGIAQRVERQRQAGPPPSDSLDLKPSVDIAPEKGGR